MAFTAVDTQIFKPGLGTIQIGNYSSAGVTFGTIPVAGNITIFAVMLQSNNTGSATSPHVDDTFPITGQSNVPIATALNDFGTYMIYYI